MPSIGRAQSVSSRTLTFSAFNLFAYADHARDAGDFATAAAAYRALASNPDIELRTEARFRLGLMLADKQHRYRDAAIEFRRILDEKPKAARVRLELARVEVLLGRANAAAREFRAVEANGGLPPQVEQMIRFYTNGLTSHQKFGGGFELGISPDSNINRTTQSATLDTVIGDITLDKNARAQSGVGLTLRGQGFWRQDISRHTDLLVRLSSSVDAYRASSFNDVSLTMQAGPELTVGRDKVSVAGGPTWRWYGNVPYSITVSVAGDWQHPVGRRSQFNTNISIGHVDNKFNTLQTGAAYTLALGFDRAFSSRFRGGIQASGERDTARSSGYATASGGMSGYMSREVGRTTAVFSLAYSHLAADTRLLLLPQRRVDDRFAVGIAGSFRALRIGSFAPIVRFGWERNRSTVAIYDYKRVTGEIGVVTAF